MDKLDARPLIELADQILDLREKFLDAIGDMPIEEYDDDSSSELFAALVSLGLYQCDMCGRWTPANELAEVLSWDARACPSCRVLRAAQFLPLR